MEQNSDNQRKNSLNFDLDELEISRINPQDKETDYIDVKDQAKYFNQPRMSIIKNLQVLDSPILYPLLNLFYFLICQYLKTPI
jgi:hypothetical protein